MIREEMTPGPWTIDKAPWDDGIIDGNGRRIVGCYGAGSRANVRAIAALPELVEVALKVATHFEDTDAPLGIEARAALHKAGLL